MHVTARRKTTPPRAATPRRRATPVKRSRPVKSSSLTARRPVPAVSGLAPGMQAINSYLAVTNVATSMDFLERVFGFTRGVVLPDPDGQLRYAEMRHGTAVVMLIRKGDDSAATGGAAGLYTYVPDVDRVLSQAREAGATVSDAEDRPWGDRVAAITDPDGYQWVLATFKKLVPFA